MDFRSLTRKELQILCKKNKIPANLTNVAMADSLASLHHVEGLEEFLESKSEPQKFSEEAVFGSPDVPRTSCRTSTRRKPISKEPESLQVLTQSRSATRQAVVEEVDQEKIEIVPKTPAAPSGRRAPPASARKKMESQKDESSVQRAYSTRRSVRLLEKTIEKLSLVEDRKIQPMKIDDDNGLSVTVSGTYMQTSSEVCLEKTEDLEVSSALKSDGSTEIQSNPNNDDVQEEREDHVFELEDTKSKSKCMGLVEKSDENMDVTYETFDGKEMDNVQPTNCSYETQNSHSEDSKSENDLRTEDALAAKISDGVSVDIITQDIAPKSSLRLEENEFSIVKKPIGSIPLNPTSPCESVQAENSKNLSSEASVMSESLTLKSIDGQTHILTINGSYPHVAEDDCQRKVDFESESITEEDNGDDSIEEESVDCEATDENLSGRSEHVSDDKVESEEKQASLADVNVVEAEVATAENCYQREGDFESNSATEEEIGDDSSKEESAESEASDDESVESEASDEEATDTKNANDENAELEEANVDASLFDVVVAEAEVAMKTESQISFHVDGASMQNSFSSGALVDVPVISAEDFTASNEGPASLKEVTPVKHMISGSKVTSKSPLPTFSADQLSGQFPRPTLSTPSKSSSKTHPIIQMITEVLDENEENMAVPPAGQHEIKKSENPTDDNGSMLKLYEGTSLRQLQKMLREKLQIENEKKVGKSRIALQTLPENCMAADELQKENYLPL